MPIWSLLENRAVPPKALPRKAVARDHQPKPSGSESRQTHLGTTQSSITTLLVLLS
jgi:hypothetical protein